MSMKNRAARNAKEASTLFTFKLLARGYEVNFAATTAARAHWLTLGFKPANLPKSRDSLKVVHSCDFNKR